VDRRRSRFRRRIEAKMNSSITPARPEKPVTTTNDTKPVAKAKQTPFNLRTEEGIKAAYEHLKAHPPERQAEWNVELQAFLKTVAVANRATRASVEFHKILWEENPISSVGMGSVPVQEVIGKVAFREWVADTSLTTLPTDRKARTATLNSLYSELIEQFKGPGRRIPHLKIFRVLAAFFPSDFTTIADRGSLERLARRLRGVAGETYIAQHAYIRDRLDEVLGAAGDSEADQAARMALPWYLYALTSVEGIEEEKVAIQGEKSGDETLVPLPAARRRRGLTSIAGLFPSVLEILQEIKEGITREEFLDYLRVRYPALKEQSRRMIINVLRSELGVLKNVDDLYTLTERGAAALETSSAAELGEWLLTRVFGIDHVLKAVEKEPLRKEQLVALLQKAHPGWTSAFAPAAMVNWLVSMKAISRTPKGHVLDTLGQEWVDRVTWAPESLQSAIDSGDEVGEEVATFVHALTLPSLVSVVKHVSGSGIFPESLIEQLHLGLWSPRRRHFAVLAGISGSGKTLLARKYAEALGTAAGDGPQRHLVQAVQPGWYDPSPLLGYINPLQKDAYQRTECLMFLLRASQDPSRPYVLILDEMNLSHPEQYFAPLLSAMESEERILLHSEGEGFDVIPESIPYPTNLAIIGTVNMDETTHGLSDKVLDRAFTLEFWDIQLGTYPRWGDSGLSQDEMGRLRTLLTELMSALAPARLHFGWRTVDDVVDFLASARSHESATSFEDLLDAVIYAKVLPKLRGDDSVRTRSALEATRTVLANAGLKRCSERVLLLREELVRAGAVRFWR
jgi:5-methylcytosine-specific restriction enzyme B